MMEERWVLYKADESLNSTLETDNILYLTELNF